MNIETEYTDWQPHKMSWFEWYHLNIVPISESTPHRITIYDQEGDEKVDLILIEELSRFSRPELYEDKRYKKYRRFYKATIATEPEKIFIIPLY